MIHVGSTCRMAAMLAGLALLAACQPQAVVDVETTPARARVYLNGKYIGKSPVKAEIRDRNAPGEDIWEHHVIRAEADGYLTSRKDLKYRQGAPWLPEVVHLRLEPDPNSPLPKAYTDPAVENRPKAKWVHIAEPRKETPETPPTQTPPVMKPAETQPAAATQPAAPPATQPASSPAETQPAETQPATQPAASQPASKPATSPEVTGWPTYPKPTPQPTPTTQPATTAPETQPAQKPAPETQPASETQPAAAAKPKKSIHESPTPRELPAEKNLEGTSPWSQIARWDPAAPPSPLKKLEGRDLPLGLRPKGLPKQTPPTPENESQSTPTTQPVISPEPRLLSPHELAAGTTSPWQKVLPGITVKSTGPAVLQKEAVIPPQQTRRLICELRLVRLRDGHVVAQVSAPAVYRNLPKLADALLANLEASMPDTPPAVAAISLCNRRQSPQGQLVCNEMNKLLAERLEKSNACKFVDTIDFRPVLKTEIQLEKAADISNAETLHLLKDAEYVILGGLALEAIPTSLQQARRDASRRSQY